MFEVVCRENGSLRVKFDNLYVQLVSVLNSSPNNTNIKNASNEKNKNCKPLNIMLISYDSGK